MTSQHIAQIGVVFLGVGFAAMFLMYYLWGFAFDKATRTSAAPRWACWLHRVLGYVFVATYVAIMWHMVPRLWQYQVEFPARTTIHILLGFSLGFLLIVKIAVMRFFRHFEEWMPYLGTTIMLCAVLLLGLSLPFVFQEQALAANAPGGDVFGPHSRQRVADKLPHAGLPGDAPLAELAGEAALRRGREILLSNCVKCHDLKTILAKPRTPQGWWQTVERMGEKPALFRPIHERDQWAVTAYLVAITPDLQRSVKKVRDAEVARQEAIEQPGEEAAAARPGEEAAAAEPGEDAAAKPMPVPVPAKAPPAKPAVATAPAIDPAKAKATYEEVCSQCHELADVDANPPTSRRECEQLVKRMIQENDAELTRSQVRLVTFWLEQTYVVAKR